MTDLTRALLDRIETIDTTAADTTRRSDGYQRMTEDLKEVTGRASSPDGVVTVIAGAGGAVTAISFTDAIRAVSPALLAASTVAAIAQARALAARAQAEVIRRGLGDTEALDRVLDSDERLFGDQRPDTTIRSSVPARRPRPVEEQEDFENIDLFGQK